jgi:D-lactate dehydrogenase (cytochrome)
MMVGWQISMALKDILAVKRNEIGITAALGVLKQRYGERFQTGADIRTQHGHTTTYIPNQAPDGVVFPESTAEVADIVKICAGYRVPIIPYGTGTSLEGHVNAPGGGICVDTWRYARTAQY